MKVFNNLEEIQPYFDDFILDYVFKEDGEYLDIELKFNLNINRGIHAGNIKALDINARFINGSIINAKKINADGISYKELYCSEKKLFNREQYIKHIDENNRIVKKYFEKSEHLGDS